MEPGAFGANVNVPTTTQPPMMPLESRPWNLDLMPWTVATKSEQPGGVMQFSAQNALLQDTIQKRAQLHHKRKSNIVPTHTPKQFISEEKITAHFNGLHISSSHIHPASDEFDESHAVGISDDAENRPSTSGKCFTNLTYQDYQVTAKELEEKLKKANRITICDEIKKLQAEQKKVSFLPNALLNRVERPCTALVLWQPPPIIELLQKTTGDSTVRGENPNNMTDEAFVGNNIGDDDDNFEPIDDFIDNNNTCNLDFNNLKLDGMDTDL